MPDLIAKKSLVYGTRRMRAGDGFTARRSDAQALIATGMASPAETVPAREPESNSAPIRKSPPKRRPARKKAAI